MRPSRLKLSRLAAPVSAACDEHEKRVRNVDLAVFWPAV